MGYLAACLAMALLALTSGCTSVAYYGQAIRGHFEVMGKAQPITSILENPATPDTLKRRLRLALEIRAFATQALGLPDNRSYSRYADLGRTHVTWAVVATPEFSVEPQRWCFPVVGCLSYRGFFDQKKAEKEAEFLKKQGFDVDVAGSSAYSTLGWFDDPLLNTLLYGPEERLAEVIFHELAHQKLYIQGDTTFNESFAVALSQHGVISWLQSQGRGDAVKAYQQQLRQEGEFQRLLLDTRSSLQRIYANKLGPADKKKEKAESFARMRQDYEKLKRSWPGRSGYDAWMAQELNNAHLSLVSTYHELVPQIRDLIRQCCGNLPRFYRQIESWRGLEPANRRERLTKADCL